MKNKLIGLNEKQKEFVLSEGKHILLIAGPGAGKTLVVTRKVGWLLDKRVSAEKIFCISFTRAAAKELNNRISKVDTQGKNVYTGTFHSFVIDMMKKYCKQDFNIISDGEKKIILNDICKSFDIKNQNKLINSFKQSIKSDEKSIQYGINEYILKLKLLNLMDIDILLPIFFDLLTSNNELLEQIREDIRYFFYDEAQDINKIQNDILTKIIPPDSDKGLILIGDEDQNLYEWNNTSIDYILKFENLYNANKYILDENYRSSNQIIAVCNKLIKNNTKRFDKTIKGFFDSDLVNIQEFDNEEKEVLRIIGTCTKYDSKKQETLAILCRSNKEIEYISKIIEKFDIKFNSSSKKAFDRDTVDAIKVIVNPHNDLLFSKFMDISGEDKLLALENRTSLYEVLLSKKDEKALLIQELNFTSRNISAASMLKVLHEKTPISIDATIENALHLWTSNLSTREINNIQNFINYLESKEAQENLKEGSSNINIMTIHTSKGLEFDEVILFNFNNMNYTYKGDTEETRRIIYVGMSRAKKKLNIYYTNKSIIRNNQVDTKVSPFINEFNIK